MRRVRPLPALVSAMLLVVTLVVPGPGQTRVSSSDTDAGSSTARVTGGSPALVRPIAVPYGPPDYVAAPEIISRVGEVLSAIDSPQKRSELAEQWLRYSREVIAKDLEYRRQWLDLQREQVSQLRQVEQLRLEVARLQAQVEELRARNVQLERENLQASAQLAPRSGR